MADTTTAPADAPAVPDALQSFASDVAGALSETEWDADALALKAPDGGTLVLRYDFGALKRFKQRGNNLYALLDEVDPVEFVEFLACFAEGKGMSDAEAFAWYGRLGHAVVYAAASRVVDRTLRHAGMLRDTPPDADPPA